MNRRGFLSFLPGLVAIPILSKFLPKSSIDDRVITDIDTKDKIVTWMHPDQELFYLNDSMHIYPGGYGSYTPRFNRYITDLKVPEGY